MKNLGLVIGAFLTVLMPFFWGQKAYGAVTGEFANVVVFVDFADTDHSKHLDDTSMITCFLESPEENFKLFNGDAENRMGMAQYISAISYGQLRVKNIFPQYDASQKKFQTFRLAYNYAHYRSQSDAVREAAIVQEVVAWLQTAGVADDLDLNKDGCVDNLSIVLACEPVSSDARVFNGRKNNFGADERINGSQVACYNILTEDDIYQNIVVRSGVIVHEFLHTVGYPDMYRNNGNTGMPVGNWCIEARVSYRLQYPLAYLRSVISGWFTMETLRSSRTGCSLYAADATTFSTKDRQAMILKTNYSDTEFFVVEYRRKAEVDAFQEYDRGIPGSGLIIYRVNTKQASNAMGPPDMIYVFRPGDTYDASGREAGAGSLQESFLSAQSGRTTYGSADASHSLSDGAITYSDGTNSGIVIRNVGNADGDTITFDVEFHEVAQGGSWLTESEHGNGGVMEMASCMAPDGTLYVLEKMDNSSGKAILYSYTSGTWKQVGQLDAEKGRGYQLAWYGNACYVAYADGGNRVRLVRFQNGGKTSIYQSSANATEIDLEAGESGIYLAYNNLDSSVLYAFQYKPSEGIKSLGELKGRYLANPGITEVSGSPALLYRDFYESNKLRVLRYVDGTWSPVGQLDLSAGGGELQGYKDNLYLMQNGDGSHIYTYNFGQENAGWSKVGSMAYANESAPYMSLFFQGAIPYVAYYGGSSQEIRVMTPVGEKWEGLGGRVGSESINGLSGYTYNGQVYIVYLNMVTHKTMVKSHDVPTADRNGMFGDSGKTEEHVHSWITKVVQEATCTVPGKRQKICEKCGEVSSQEAIPATGHSYGNWTTVKEATISAEGSQVRKCAKCGAQETRSIARLEQKDSVRDFVARLYQEVLGRKPDSAGLESWTKLLKAKEVTGAQVAYGFVFSKEYQEKGKGTQEFLTMLYHSLLNRAPDAQGMQNWIQVSESGVTRKYLFGGFANSREFQNLCSGYGIVAGSYSSDDMLDRKPEVTAFVTRMYVHCLERRPDQKGLYDWVRQLLEGKAGGGNIAEGFFYSKEFLHKNMSDEKFVTLAYRTLLGREPDAAGFRDWCGRLRKGAQRSDVLNGFLKSQEFGELCRKYGIRE